MSASQTHTIVPGGIMIPVFCTANMPEKTLSLLLERDAEHRAKDSFRLFVVKDISDDAIEAINNQHSQAPFQTFDSPFIGAEISQLCKIFYNKFNESPYFSSTMFFVLDNVSAWSETVLVIAASRPGDKEDTTESLRTDFWAARQIATMAEIGELGLLEPRDFNHVYTSDEVPMQF